MEVGEGVRDAEADGLGGLQALSRAWRGGVSGCWRDGTVVTPQ